MPLRARILLFDGFDELDAIAPYEVLMNGLRGGAEGDVAYVTLEGAREVTASHGTIVWAGAALGDDATLLIVPGGGWNDRSRQGAWAEAQRGEVPKAIAAAHAAGSDGRRGMHGRHAALGRGLLDGRPAITHRSALEELAATGAEVVEARVVDDGDMSPRAA